jgi:F-type H+-transporting ATPase subunit a
MSNPISNIRKFLILNFKKEVSFTLNKKEQGREVLILIVFYIILVINFLALYPQTFSPTSHLTVTLPLSLLFWLSLILFGWIKNTNHILSHLVPQGTPGALIIFIVIIELVRNLIRPITLCVRLTANLIAGHLLMSLLGNALNSITMLGIRISMIAPITLTILESAVACIQAYVFITLVTLYTTEVK